MISAYARNAIVLGLLAAVGPFAIDTYLPALPTIAADLHTTARRRDDAFCVLRRVRPRRRLGRPQA
jgi:hypothetical protein